MRLYRLRRPGGQASGQELAAPSDELARVEASDRYSDILHRDPAAYLERWGADSWVAIADNSPITPSRPPSPQAQPGRRTGELRPLPTVKLYDEDSARRRFGELAETLSQVQLAIRQLARAQAAHRAEQTRRIELGFVEGYPPDELVALEDERSDAMEFAIIAARRAVRAHWYLTTKRDTTLPGFRQQEMIWALRDLYEHWHEWKVLERGTFLDDNRWLATKDAGRRWDAASGSQRPEGTAIYSAGPPPGPFADPEGRIITWSGIDIDVLTEDLEKLHGAIANLEREAFEWEQLDEAGAVELVGPTMWTLIHYFTNVRGQRARDGVARWDRAPLLAADRTLRDQRWIINGEVLGPHDDVRTDDPTPT